MDATGIENIMLRGLVMGMSKKEIDQLTPEICEFSGLGEYVNMPVRTYSTGMMMRLGVLDLDQRRGRHPAHGRMAVRR